MSLGIDGATESFLNSLDRIQERMRSAQERISSGTKVRRPEDAPELVGEILRLQADVAQADQWRQNLERVQARTDAAEGALQQAVRLMESAIAAGMEGASTAGADTRRPILAEKVAHLLEQMVGLASTQVEGRFVFGGDDDTTAPFTWNPVTGMVEASVASAATRRIELPGGTLIPVALSAGEIFDVRDSGGSPAAGNVLDALTRLRDALASGDGDAVAAVLPEIRAAGELLNRRLAYYGNVQRRLESAIELAAQYHTEGLVRLGELRDADVVAEISSLQQAQFHQQAALGARSQVGRLSLFDYFK